MKPSDVHAAADRAGVLWDGDAEFMDRCEGLTGKRHLDSMSEDELKEVVDDLEMQKQAAELTKLAQAIPAEVLQAAQGDPDIKGTVLKAGGAYRAPIYDGDDVVGFFTPREEGEVWRLGPIFVLPGSRGKGLASSAVREFMAGRKGRAEIDEDNEASQRLFEAAGFERDGDGWVKEASNTFTHNDKTYDVEKLWGAGGKARAVDPDKMLKSIGRTWGDGDEKYGWRDVERDPAKYKDDQARVDSADLGFPILTYRGTVVDGIHRLMKAKETGDTVQARRLSASDMRAAQVKTSSTASMLDWAEKTSAPRHIMWSGFDDELEKLGGARINEILSGLKSVLTERTTPTHLRAWSRHAALNLGIAESGIAQAFGRNKGKPWVGSRADELKDAAHAAAFAAMPPTHHTVADMAGMFPFRHRDYYRWGAGRGKNPELGKTAGHAEDRLSERAPKVDPDLLPAIEEYAGTQDLDTRKSYHAPLPGGAYAVLGPVGKGKSRRHVIKTVLTPEMHPPGRMLKGSPMKVPEGTMAGWRLLNSSNLDGSRYDSAKKRLEVKFKSGGHYGYKDVPAVKARGLHRAKSSGKYFHKHIKGTYDFDKVAEAAFFDELEKLSRTTQATPELKTMPSLADVGNQIATPNQWHSILDPASGVTGHVRMGLQRKGEPRAMWLKPLDKEGSALMSGFEHEFHKLAATVATELLPHQQRVLDKLDRSGGVLVIHGLGSGKTLTSIAAGAIGEDPMDVVVPASLAANYEKEVEKHTEGDLPRRVRSYEKATRDGLDSGGLVVLDEAHRLRNTGTKRHEALFGPAQLAKMRLLLTGTPIYNAPSDLASLANIAAGEDVVPSSPLAFNSRYIRNVTVRPTLAQRLRGIKSGELPRFQNKAELVRALTGYVDVHDPESDDFPSREDEVVEVPMSSRQRGVYDFLLNKAPGSLREKIRSGLPPSKQESRALNAYLTGVRQVSGSPRPYVAEMSDDEEDLNTPKIQKALASLLEARKADPNFRALVYSNFLGAGLDPYSRGLDREGVPHSKFTGGVSKRKRAEMVEAFNAGESPVLLVSSSGGEGLDLKGTKLVQILEPHFNNPKIEQVIGRARRYRSHAHLPEDERSVRVQRFLSVLPERRGFLGGRKKNPSMSTDQWLQRQADTRDSLTNAFMEALRDASQRSIEKIGSTLMAGFEDELSALLYEACL